MLSPGRLEAHLADLERRVAEAGYTLVYQDYIECAELPGLLGAYAGVTLWDRREIRISLKATPSIARRCNVLAHELRHALDPEWDCGNRPIRVLADG